jgi:hypothetical protein
MIDTKNELLGFLRSPLTETTLQCAKQVVVKHAGMLGL